MPKIIVTEEQWIQLGAERFARGGPEALVIESMSSELKCSKSSFYWYFTNRSAFIRRIVDDWIEKSTQKVITASLEPIAAEEKLTELLCQMLAVTRKGDFLFYLRKLSAEESDYQEVLDQMERARMNFAQALFMQIGLPAEAADHKAWFLYHYYLGWYERHKLHQLTEEDVLHHVTLLREHLIQL